MKDYASTAICLMIDNHNDKVVIHGVVDEDPFYHIIWNDWHDVEWFIQKLRRLAEEAFASKK